MPKESPGHHSDYFYHASAFGLAARLERPANRTIATKAATTLASIGGHSTDHAEDFKMDGPVSFRSAHVEVGGSYDESHHAHTSFASAVVEGLNIHNVVTADRIVSRLSIKYPGEGSDPSEPSITPTGSYFENLRIAGHKIDIHLNTSLFHTHDTYSGLNKCYMSSDELEPWLHWSKFDKLSESDLEKLENHHHSVMGMYERFKQWKTRSGKTNGAKDSTSQPEIPKLFWCSLAGHLNMPDHVKGPSELRNLGSIICIPNFGVVHLAELLVEKRLRRLRMLRVEMGSPVGATFDTTGTTGSGGTIYP